MPSENWKRVQELFEAVADLPRDEQTQFLSHAPAGEETLREVRALLESDRKRGAGIASVVEGQAQLFLDVKPPAGVRLGAYRVLREIGRGGMGTVYLAVRDDDQYRKQVAVKIVRLGMDSEEGLSRFRHERRILAKLEHPYIARIVDGGSTTDGRPYLVMEYVEGVPITSFCDGGNLSIDERLVLFQKVCEAVQYAHRQLIVHRDLKPSNILVEESGAPRLLDFGIAKLLDDTENSITQTGGSGRLLTPRNASPEQALGQPISTSSDVYSLGTILYQILTGHPAHKLAGSSPEALLQFMREDKVAPASAAVPALAGDIDNILMTALRKDPRERYESVRQFSEDIDRYRNNLPILARPQTLCYRTGKFLRRNRGFVIAGFLAAAALIAGAGVSLFHARRAERRFDQVRQLSNSVLTGVYDRLEGVAGATETREWAARTCP